MNWEKDHNHNINYYTSLAERFGYDFKSLDWGSEQSQKKRFKILSEIADLNGKSVLDIGCGLGDFYLWLNNQHVSVEYHGTDITPKMIELAKIKYPKVSLECSDVLDSDPFEKNKFDYVFSSGIFTFRTRNSMEFLHTMIERMFELCKYGIAFNLLSSWSNNKQPNEFHADPGIIIKYCRKLSINLVLRHDYHPGDFTIYIYKNLGNGSFN